MVESLKELNRICQKPRYKEVGNWMVRHILRDAALPVTWLLLHTSVTANQVTLASLILGVLGVALFASPAAFSFLLGTVLLQIWYFLDHVDGQIARYRGTAGLTGRFFDFITHHLIHGIVFFSLGLYAYFKTGSILFVLWGFAASMGIMMFNLIHDTKYKTFFEKLEKDQILNFKTTKSLSPAPPEKKKTSPLHRCFSFLHKAIEIHVLMNVLTLASVLSFWLPKAIDLRLLLFMAYGMIAPLLAIVKISYLIRGRILDAEFEQRFETKPS